jgi:hypothetical protein
MDGPILERDHIVSPRARKSDQQGERHRQNPHES